VIRGDLTPECATAVRAVLEALGKKAGPEDDRTEDSGSTTHSSWPVRYSPALVTFDTRQRMRGTGMWS
jgi:hypothetical protein